MALDQSREWPLPMRLVHACQQRLVAMAEVFNVLYVKLLRFGIKDCSGHRKASVQEVELLDIRPSWRGRQPVRAADGDGCQIQCGLNAANALYSVASAGRMAAHGLHVLILF